MSDNLLDSIAPTLMSGTTESDGVWHCPAKDGKHDSLAWNLSGTPAFATSQTLHLGLSAKGASADATGLHMVVAYKDAAGNRNWAWSASMPVGTEWSRAEGTVTIPSGMTIYALTVSTNGSAKLPEVWLTAPTLSYGSPVTLASDAHTPYATQDHLRSEYATKAALKVTSDAVTAEVTERGRLAGRVGTLESTSGTHTSKLEQLASSIRSLVKGESTYTDPDGKSATSGIYSLVTQTRDSVTALFGSYTKTADLASTQAVKDAKKAGTDAQAAASAAQSTANTAKSAASAAQSTADTAKANAATAQSTANTAKANAATAQSTANAAKKAGTDAQAAASAAQSTADTAKADAATAQSAASRAQSTADAAFGDAGTANGRVRAVEARFAASIDGLDVRVRGVSEAVSAQGATVRDVERNMSFGLDGLVIGAADSASKVRITEKRETFEVDGKTVLALDGDTSTVEASALKIGGYTWTVTNGGKNLTLVYRG